VKVVDKWVDDTDPAFRYEPKPGGLNWDPTGGGAGYHNLTETFHCKYGEGNQTTYSFTGACFSISGLGCCMLILRVTIRCRRGLALGQGVARFERLYA